MSAKSKYIVGVDPAYGQDESRVCFFKVKVDNLQMVAAAQANELAWQRKTVVFSSVEALRKLRKWIRTPKRILSRRQRIRERRLVRRSYLRADSNLP